ncbi:MAG: MFS transporter [Candidatus Methanofastidiosa archaeon]|nr:MFS transporter [Candidatus Methanofastidiosa archaeon]
MSLFMNKNLQMVFGVTLMAIIGLSLISPALPKIQDAFQLTKTEVGLLVTAFTLPGVLVSPLVGFMSDKRGRKGIVILSLAVFSITGGSIAFIRDYNVVLIMRIFQGAAASGLSTLSMALIGDLFEGDDRAVAMGYNASVLSIGAASFPVIGGALASIAWYFPFYIFFLAIPIALIILKYMGVPLKDKDEHHKSYLRMSIRELSNMKIAVLTSSCIVTFILLYGPFMTYFPLYLSDMFEAESFTIGLLISGMSITTCVVAYFSGRIYERMGGNKPMVLGLLFYSLAMLFIYLMKDPLMGIIAVCLYGLGQGMNIPILQTEFLNSVDHEARGIVSALYSTNVRLGQSIGPVLMGLFYMVGEYDMVFLLSALISFSMGILMLIARIRKII